MRLWRHRITTGRPGDMIVGRGQRVIDVTAVLLLLLALAVAVVGVVGVAHAFVWSWTLPVPVGVRLMVLLSEAAVVAVGIVALRVVRER